MIADWQTSAETPVVNVIFCENGLDILLLKRLTYIHSLVSTTYILWQHVDSISILFYGQNIIINRVDKAST